MTDYTKVNGIGVQRGKSTTITQQLKYFEQCAELWRYYSLYKQLVILSHYLKTKELNPFLVLTHIP